MKKTKHQIDLENTIREFIPQRYIVTPIFVNDTYTDIVARFVKEFGDNDIADGLCAVEETLRRVR